MGKKQKKSKTPSQGNKKKNTDDQNKKCDSTEGKSGSEMNVEQLVTPKSAVNSGNQKESMELSNVQKASKDDDNGHQSADSWDQQDDNGRYDNLPLKTTDDIAGNSKGTKHSTAFSNLNAKAKAWDNEEITTSLNDLKVDSHYNDPWSEYRKKDSKDINLRNPSETNANKSFNAPSNWGSSSRTTHQSYDKNEKVDDGFKEFEVALKSASPKTVNYLKVKEVTGDLFAMGEDYALAHCVAEDMSMGSGIAVQFRRDFKRVDELLQQRVHQGGLAILEIKSRFIYYLVTKRESSGKPTLEKFYCSVRKWRDHVKENNVKKVAIPRLGCGLDRLEWDTVKFMLEYLFKDVNVEITVCNFQQDEDSTPAKIQNCKVAHETYPLSQIEPGTILIYFSTVDGFVSEEMKDIDKKFNFLSDFKRANKNIGECVRYDRRKDYILYGCIVRTNCKDSFNFVAFQNCLKQIQKANKKDLYSYVGYQAIKDKDKLINKKIINLLRNSLTYVEVYVCWTGDLGSEMPRPYN